MIKKHVVIWLLIGQSFLLHGSDSEDHALYDAIARGDVKAVRRHVNKDNVNRDKEDCGTPLCYAIRLRYAAVVDVLIEAGADIELEEIVLEVSDLLLKRSPLRAAVGDYDGSSKQRRNNAFAIIEILITAGVNVDAVSDDGMRALHTSAMNPCEKFLVKLIEAGALVNPSNKYGVTPLHCAARAVSEGCDENVVQLLKAGADTTIAENGGRTPLCAMRQSTMSPVLVIPACKTIEGFSV